MHIRTYVAISYVAISYVATIQPYYIAIAKLYTTYRP